MIERLRCTNRIPLAFLLSSSLASCGGGSTGMEIASAKFAYQEPTSFQMGGAVSCLHNFSPAQLRLTTDRGDFIYLNRDGNLHETTLSNLQPGEHWLYVIDYRYCTERPDCPTVMNGVSLSGIQLFRQISIPGAYNCIGLAFTVSPQGTITQ